MAKHDSTETPRPIRVGVFTSLDSAETAFQSLIDAGFGTDEISVLCHHQWQQRHFPASVAEGGDPQSVKAAATGGAWGSLLGGLGAVAGLATVAGIPVVVAGALGAALSGGVAGGLTGVMIERGFEKEDADYFDQAVSDGKILISVEPQDHSAERLQTASQLLRKAGAEPISLLEG